MTAPYRPAPAQHGSKPMTREYRKTMAFMRETMNRAEPLTEEERDELIRKAGGR